jgi:hypothetical protein
MRWEGEGKEVRAESNCHRCRLEAAFSRPAGTGWRKGERHPGGPCRGRNLNTGQIWRQIHMDECLLLKVVLDLAVACFTSHSSSTFRTHHWLWTYGMGMIAHAYISLLYDHPASQRGISTHQLRGYISSSFGIQPRVPNCSHLFLITSKTTRHARSRTGGRTPLNAGNPAPKTPRPKIQLARSVVHDRGHGHGCGAFGITSHLITSHRSHQSHAATELPIIHVGYIPGLWSLSPIRRGDHVTDGPSG